MYRPPGNAGEEVTPKDLLQFLFYLTFPPKSELVILRFVRLPPLPFHEISDLWDVHLSFVDVSSLSHSCKVARIPTLSTESNQDP